MTLLAIEGLRVGDGLVDDVSLHLDRGQRLGLIGESGSGKSLTALSVMGLHDLPVAGSIRFDGQELVGLADQRHRRLRGERMAMVFQEPMSALDPLMTVGRQLRLAGGSPEMLEKVLLPASAARRYPFELSGGQRQRVLIAMAMARTPDLLICDEPTTALDATTQAEVLDLIDALAAEHGTAVLFITHDLRVAQRMCSQIAVLRDGAIVEAGEHVLDNPQHPYTQQLVGASRLPAGDAAPTRQDPVIALESVTKSFGGAAAVEGVDLAVPRGGRVGVVGGSGSGKTTVLKLIAGLERPDSGSVRVDGRVQMVFQDPQGSLNPRLTVGRSIAEGGAGPEEVARVLEQVGLKASDASRYPHEFSGGQRQRISIARAVVGRPDIVLADEAVSALDVSVRRQVLDLFDSLIDAYDLTVVFISHDLSVIRYLCPTVVVMRDGRVVEAGPTAEVWENPQHDYTRELLAAVEDSSM